MLYITESRIKSALISRRKISRGKKGRKGEREWRGEWTREERKGKENTYEIPKSTERGNTSFFTPFHDFGVSDVVRSYEYN